MNTRLFLAPALRIRDRGANSLPGQPMNNITLQVDPQGSPRT